MTDNNARPSVATGAEPENEARPEATAASHTRTPSEEERIAALVQTLTKESADYKDRLLRAHAEMDNLRKRTDREIADSRIYGIQNFARDILAVADNMDRALGALDAELRQNADAATKALLDGVELTERELLKVLEKHGVKKFDPLGEKFDPNLHQAMFEVPDPSRPAGTVAQVMQPGYMIGERMLRPALVGVAKGGPKLSGEQPANDNAGTPQPQGSA